MSLKDIVEYHKQTGKHYTEDDIRKCARHTSNVLGIPIDIVYQQVMLAYYEYDEWAKNTRNLPKDIRDLIFGVVEANSKDDVTYKAQLQVNDSIHKKQNKHRSKHFNPLWTLINKYPTSKWNHDVWSNPNTTMKHIEKALQNGKMNSWDKVVMNPNVTLEFVEKNIPEDQKYRIWGRDSRLLFEYVDKYGIPEDQNGYSRIGKLTMVSNPYLTIDFVKKHSKINWGTESYVLSQNKGITMKDIEDNPKIQWNYDAIYLNPNLTVDFLKRILYLYEGGRIYLGTHAWVAISKNANITMKDIEYTLHDERYKWQWKGISKNPNLTIEFIKKYMNSDGTVLGPQGEPSWHDITQNPGISMDDIVSHPELPWRKWDIIVQNPNYTVEYAEKYIELNGGNPPRDFFYYFSGNPNLTPEFVDKYIDGGWDWRRISANEFRKNKYHKAT